MNPNNKMIGLLLVCVMAISIPVSAGDYPECKSERHTCEKQIREMLRKKRYMGVALQNTDWGTVVKRVEGESPAESAGLMEGDRIIGVDGRNTERKSPHEIKALLMPYDREDQPVTLTIVRLGEVKRLSIRMAPMPESQIDEIVASHLARRHASRDQPSQAEED